MDPKKILEKMEELNKANGELDKLKEELNKATAVQSKYREQIVDGTDRVEKMKAEVWLMLEEKS